MAVLPALRGALSALLPNIGTRGDLDARITSSPLGYVVPGQPYQPDWDVNRAVTEGYEWNPYIYRAVEFVAANERARNIVLREGNRDDGPIIDLAKQSREQRRILQRLNRQANQWEIAQIWRHRLIAQFMLSARGVFVEVVRARSGGIHSLYLLDPDRVDIVPGRVKANPNDPANQGAITPIESFRITTGTPNSRYWDWRPPYDPTSTAATQPSGILWVRSPHPTILARGTSPMKAAALSADLDRQARLYNLRFMQEDGRPGGVLSVKGPIDDDNTEILKARFKGNGNPGRTSVIEADEVKWVDTSGTPREMQWADTMDRTAKEFCVAFGLPMSVISDSAGETFDNSDADYAKAWEHGMLPLFRMIDAQLDLITPGGLDDDTYLAHDVSDVWVLGRHQRAREDRAADDLDRGAITIDEYREICGRDPWNVPATRVLWIPAQRLAVGDGKRAHDGDDQAAGEAPLGGAPPPPPAGAPGMPGALPPGANSGLFDLPQLGAGNTPGATDDAGAGSDEGADQPPRRAVAAGRTPPGAALTAQGEPETKSRDQEGEQSGARPPGR